MKKVCLLFILMLTIVSSSVYAENKILFDDVVIDSDSIDTAYVYDVANSELDLFLEKVAKVNEIPIEQFKISEIPSLSMKNYLYEDNDKSISVTQIENTLSYGYTSLHGDFYYNISSFIKENDIEISDKNLDFADRKKINNDIESLIKSLGIP